MGMSIMVIAMVTVMLIMVTDMDIATGTAVIIMDMATADSTITTNQIRDQNQDAGLQSNAKKPQRLPKRPKNKNPKVKRRLKNQRKSNTNLKEDQTGQQKRPNGKPTLTNSNCFFRNKHSEL